MAITPGERERLERFHKTQELTILCVVCARQYEGFYQDGAYPVCDACLIRLEHEKLLHLLDPA